MTDTTNILPTDYCLHGSTVLSSYVDSIQPIIASWADDYLSSSMIQKCFANNACQQADMLTVFFQRDTWLRTLSIELLKGHVWALLQDKCYQHFVGQLLKTQPIDIGCKASRLLASKSLHKLAKALYSQSGTNAALPTVIAKQMLQTGYGWLLVEVHFEHWSLLLLISPAVAQLPQTFAPTDDTPLTSRQHALSKQAMTLDVQTPLSHMPLTALHHLQIGQTFRLATQQPLSVTLCNQQGINVAQGELTQDQQHLAIMIKG